MRTTPARLAARLVTFVVAVAVFVAGLGHGPVALAAVPQAPQPTTPPLVSAPAWHRGTLYDDANTTRVPPEEAERFARFWTAMFLGAVDNPELRAQLDQLGIDAVGDTGGPTGASVDTAHPTATAASPPRPPVPQPLQAYIDSDKTVEGLFRRFSEGEQRYLIVHLVAHWHRNVPGFSQSMQLAETQPALKLMRHLDLANTAAAVIFDKQRLKNGLSGPFGGDDRETTVPAGAPVPGAVTATDEAKSVLDQARVALLAPDAVSASVVPPQLTNLAEQVQRFVPPLTVDPGAEADRVADAAAKATGDPPGIDDVQALVDKASYQACAALPGASQQCKTQPLGVAASFDLDGVVGPDVRVTLLPDAAASPGGLGGRVEATRLSASAAKATVVTRMYLEEAQGQLSAGFVELPAPLQTAALGLDNPLAARDGDVRLRATVTHTGVPASTNLTLLGGFARLDDPRDTTPSDPMTATVRFERAPTLFLARARLVDNVEQAKVEVNFDAPLSTPKVTATVTRASAGTRRTATVVVDSLPDRADAVVDLKAPEGITVDYTASKPIRTLTATATTSSGGGSETLSAAFTDVPAVIHAVVGEGRVAYQASSRLTRGTVSRVVTTAGGALRQRMAGTVEGVPSAWSVEAVRNGPLAVKYHADLPIDRLSASYADVALDRAGSAEVEGVPAGLTTVNLDAPSGALSYTAPAKVAKVAVTARVKGFDAGLSLTGIPRTWTANFGDDGVGFTAGDEGIELVSATVTNHGAVTRPAGNHAAVNVVERAVGGGKVVRDVDASLAMAKVKNVSVRTGEPAVVTVEAGGGAPFRAVASLRRLNGLQAGADATLTPLPARVQASIGRTTAITASSNFDLRASVRHAGSGAAMTDLGSVPVVHGLAVRDGKSGSQSAFGAELWLTGLPTTVTIGSGSFTMRDFRPKVTTLVVDLDLDDTDPEPVKGFASIAGLPSQLDLDVSSSSRPVAGGGTELKVVLDGHGKSLGALRAEMRRGGTGGRVDVSSVPRRIEGTFSELEGKNVVDWKSDPIDTVHAEFRHGSATGALTARGHVTLRQIPGNFTITAGRDPGGSGPALSYHANAGGLDLEVFADGSLRSAASTLKANLEFRLLDLPKDVEILTKGGKLELVTAGRITEIFAKVSASYSYNKEGHDELNDGSWLSFPYEYRVNIGAGVDNLRMALRNVSSFSFEPGILSKVGGRFESFDFGWDALPLSLDLFGSLRARIDWPAPFGSSTVLLARASIKVNDTFDVQFHRYTNTRRPWVSASTSILWLCTATLTTSTRPGRDGSAFGSAGVRFADPSSVGGHYYVVPNPGGIVPAALVDLAAFALASPRELGASFKIC